VLVLAGAAHPAPAAGATLTVSGSVKTLSADGHRVAADVVTETRNKTCHRILLWKGSGKPTSVNAGCVDKLSHDQNVTELALAGTRLLWVDYQYGNHAYCSLMSATVARPRATEVDFCDPLDADTFVGGLAGDGPLLVFNSWYDANQEGRITDIALYRVSGTKSRQIMSGPRSRTVTSVDSGLIAIRESSGAAAAYRSDGSLIHRFAIGALSARLDGASTLVVRKATTLTPWDLSTATDGTPRSLKGGKLARFEDVQNGIAVYVLKTTIHLLRLADGRDVAIRVAGKGPVHAQIERPGLFYSTRNRVTFVPMAAVRRLLG